MKAYNCILLATVTIFVALCAAVMLWAQPLSGDLTRIGGYPERWFGWTQEQQRNPASTHMQRVAGKRHILVVGDSFSEAGFWQGYLSDKYTFDFIHAGHIRFPDLLRTIEEQKPDAVVMESAERTLPDFYAAGSNFIKTVPTCDITLHEKNLAPEITEATSPIAAMPAFETYNRKTTPDSAHRISEGFHYLKLVAKAAIKPKKRKAVTLSLNTRSLFSSQKPDQLLVLAKDFLLDQHASPAMSTAIECSMQNAGQQLQQHNIAFVFLAVPDKTTAYQPYLADQALREKTALLDTLRLEQLPQTINLLPWIRLLLANGEKDVYLPDDTHWGYKGFRLTAALVDRELAAQWTSSGSAP